MPNYPYDSLQTPLDLQNLETTNNNFEAIAADIASTESASIQRDDSITSDYTSKLNAQKNEYTGRLDAQYSDYTTKFIAQKNEYTGLINAQNEKVDNVADQISDQVFQQIVDDNRTVSKTPVANFAAIAMTYPNPENGWEVQTLDDGKIYRRVNDEWVYVAELTPGPVNGLRDESLTYYEQTDFVDMVGGHVEYEKMYYKRENSVNWITVMLKKGNEHVSWTFRNNTYDDYQILGDCFAGVASVGPVIYQDVDYQSNTGTWVTTAPNTHYATSVGATMTATITGDSIEFHHYADDRGGIWEFVVDGDTLNKKTVSTWKATATATNSVSLFTGLTFGSHTIVGTFKGDDPAHVPSTGAGTSRGWVYVNGANNYKTFRSFKQQISNSRVKDFLVGFSNKEFAVKLRKKDVGTHQFVPMHSNIGTAFNAEPARFIADGAEVTPSSLVIGEFIECTSFRLAQHVYGRNPDSGTENLVDIETTVTINKKGAAEINGKMTVLVDVDVLDGYFVMTPLAKPLIDRAATSINNSYACTKTDGSKTYLVPEKDRAISYAFVSSTEKDYVTAVRFNDYKNTLRTNASGKYASNMNTWLEHRDATLTKLYASSFANTTLTAGQSYRFAGTIIAAKIAGVNGFI